MYTFEITIHRKYQEHWPVVVRYQASPTALTLWASGECNLDLAELELIRPSDEEYSKLIGKSLFRKEIRDAFIRALSGTKASTEPLRVLLIIEADELRPLHWEQLFAPFEGGRWDYLLLNQQTPFSLYLPSQIERRFPPIGRRDLRALLLISGPEELDGDYGLASFDVPVTVDSIRASLGEIPCDVLSTSIEGAVGEPSLKALCEHLTVERYTILHIVCHGAYKQDYKPNIDETILYLPKDDQRSPVTGSELIKGFNRLNPVHGLPHFIFLSTCESADPRAESGLGGLGQRLVRELGMPAVLAMTSRVSIQTAQALAESFYSQLNEHGEVDTALAEALVGLQGRFDITIPALFSRLGGRPLFSDALDRPLTEEEITYGLGQLNDLIKQRAPILLEDIENQSQIIQATLGVDVTAISAQARHEHEKALATINQLSNEALDLSFNSLALGQKTPEYDDRCPFRGLYPFRAEDREFFFGRQALVKTLSERLLEHRFLAVLGPSGCGKSSLVLAGVVPDLDLPLAYLTPGRHPLAQLDAALSSIKPDSLVVVDQFEELFTLCMDENERQTFIARLLELPDTHYVAITMRADFLGECAYYPELREKMENHQKLIAPMGATKLRRAMERQADHVGLRFEAGLGEAILDDVQDEPGAMPLLQHALLLLWQRRHGQWLRWKEYRSFGGIREAIATTADDVYIELGNYEKERMRDIFLRLTRLEDGRSPGEVRDTSRRVELAELIPVGSDPADTVTLVKHLADSHLVVTNVNPASSVEEVDVAHEALIRHWPRLRDWLDEDRTWLRLREGVREAALEWEVHQRDENYLVHRAGRLEDAMQLMAQPGFSLNKLEQGYLHACTELQNRELLEKEEQQRRELEAARKLAKMQQARADDQAAATANMRRRALIIAAVGVVAILMAIFAIFYFIQARGNAETASNNAATATANLATAEAARATATANLATADVASTLAVAEAATAEAAEASLRSQLALSIARQGQALYEEEPLLGLRLAMEAWSTARTSEREVQDTIIEVVREMASLARLLKIGNNVWGIHSFDAFSLIVVQRHNEPGSVSLNGGKMMPLSGVIEYTHASPSDTYFVVDYTDKKEPSELIKISGDVVPLSGQGSNVIFSPEGTYFTISYTDDIPRELRHDSGEETPLKGDFERIEFSPDESCFVVKYVDAPGELHLTSGKVVQFPDKITHMKFSPNSAYSLVKFDSDPGSTLYRVNGELVSLAGTIDDVFFGPEGTYFVIDYLEAPGEYHLGRGEVVQLLHEIDEVYFSPDESYFVVDYVDAPSEIRRPSGEVIPFLDLFDGNLVDVKFSPEGNYFNAQYYKEPDQLDTRIMADFGEYANQLVNANGEVISLTEENQTIHFSPDDSYFVVDYSHSPGEIHLESGVVVQLPDKLYSVYISSEGNYVIINYPDSPDEIRTANGELLLLFSNEISRVFFSKDESYIIIDYADVPGEIYLESGEVIPLTGEIEDVFPSKDESYIIIDYVDIPGEIYLESGEVIPLIGEIEDVNFSKDYKFFVITFLNNRGQLWFYKNEPQLITDLGYGTVVSEFDTNNMRLITGHIGGLAYLLDLQWLMSMGDDPRALPIEDLVKILCNVAFKSELYDEAVLINFLGDREPQACKQ